MLVALPLLAAGRAAWEFFSGRLTFEPWVADAGGPVPVEVEVEPPRARPAVAPLESVDGGDDDSSATPPEPPPAAAER